MNINRRTETNLYHQKTIKSSKKNLAGNLQELYLNTTMPESIHIYI